MRKVPFIDLVNRVLEICAELELTRSILSQEWSQLSGGEQQRVMHAIGMSFSPSVVLLDEPTASLDPASQLALEKFMLARKKELVMFWITHDEEQGRRLNPDQVLDFDA